MNGEGGGPLWARSHWPHACDIAQRYGFRKALIWSVSGILCLRHIMTIRSQYAQTTQAAHRGGVQA